MRYFRTAIIHNLASPTGLAAFSYCIFLFAWSFPPELYSYYVHEPDLMFLSYLPFAFFTACFAAFLFGVQASRFLATTSRPRESEIVVGRPLLYLCVPVLLATLFCCMYLKVLGGKISFMSLLAAKDGNAIKMAGQAGQLGTGRWSASLLMLTGTLWWASYRANELKLRAGSNFVFRFVLGLGIAVNVLACTATVDRTNLMPLIAGLSVVLLFARTNARKLRIYKLALGALGAMAAVVALFLVMSMLRGSTGINLLIMGFLGYTIASYNRMAALLLGVMHDSYEGQGALLFPMLRSGYFDSLFHFNSRFNWPSGFSLWFSSINSVRSAGLSAAFNYYSVFGALYTDLGWAAPAYMFLIGILTGYLWISFRRGKTPALIMYPWCAFCILFWTGFNVMFDGRLLDMIKIAVLLSIYDRVKVHYVRNVDQVRSVPEPFEALMRPANSPLNRGFF